MVALLLVTHGDLANALVGSAKLIMGEAPLVESYGLYHGDDIDALKDTVKDAIVRLGRAVRRRWSIGSDRSAWRQPYNATARSFYELGSEVKAECITGVNLPMLLEAASGTSYMTLEELKNACLTSGPEGIVNLKDKIQI